MRPFGHHSLHERIHREASMCEKAEVLCDQCGELRECVFASDPCLEEVCGEIGPPEWWCDECWESRMMDR